MSTNPDDLNDQDDGDDAESTETNPPRRNFRRQLEEERDALRAERDRLQREVTFSRVLGPAAQSPQAKWFLKGYDGELTDEAVQAAAREAGLLQTANTNPTQTQQPANLPPFSQGMSPTEMAAHQRMANLNSPANAANSAPPDLLAQLEAASHIKGESERVAEIMRLMETHQAGSTSWSNQ